MLSGFLIGGILLRDTSAYTDRKGLIQFWIRRWFRTLPNYYLFLAVNAALIPIVHGNYLDWRFLFFLQNFITPPPPPFIESWSLTVEEWFYLSFPLFLYICFKAGLNAKRAPLYGAIVFLVGVSLLRWWWTDEYAGNWYGGAVKVTAIRLDSVMYGVLGAYLKRHFPDRWETFRVPAAVFGALLFFGLFFLFLNLERDSSSFMKSYFLSLNSLSLLLFMPLFDAVRTGSSGSAVRAVTCISLWSYSLYLCHLPAQKLFFLFFTAYMEVLPWTKVFFIPFWALTSIAIAKLCYERFERPTTALRERFSR